MSSPAVITVNPESALKKGNLPLYVTYQQDEINTADDDYSGITITTEAEGDVTIYAYKLKVANTAGVELPSTGGPGTWLFTLFGSILTAGAGWLLWRKRRLI